MVVNLTCIYNADKTFYNNIFINTILKLKSKKSKKKLSLTIIGIMKYIQKRFNIRL